jgi:hypothetical protein
LPLQNRRAEEQEAMGPSSAMILTLLTSSGIVTPVLAILVIYRGTLSTREANLIYVAATQQHHYQEQQMIVDKISKLMGSIITLSVILGLLLLTSGGIWIYEGLKHF